MKNKYILMLFIVIYATISLSQGKVDYVQSAEKKAKLGDARGAMWDYSKAIETNPSNTTAYFGRGVAKWAIFDYAGAIQDLDVVIRSQENLADAYFFRGNSKYNLGNYKGAVADFDVLVRLKPDQNAYVNRALARLNLGDCKGTISDCNEALRQDSLNEKALLYLGKAKCCLMDYNSAIDSYTKAIKFGEEEVEKLQTQTYSTKEV